MRGPAGFWQGLIIGLTTAAVFLSLRLAWVSAERKRRQPWGSAGKLR
jgi:MATE family multidrug resistance protein